MITLSTNVTLAVGAASGILIHLLHFKHGEHHLQAPKIFLSYVGLIAIAAFADRVIHQTSIPVATAFAAELVGVHLLGLFASTLLYRLFFHPLRHFPGPLDLRISKLSHVGRLLKRGCKNHELLEDMRGQYGDFVRTGPNELTIFQPEVLSVATRPGNELNHSDWYDLLLPSEPMATSRNRPDHDARRKAFDRAFSRTALNSYDDTIVDHVAQLESRISNSAGQAVEVSRLFLMTSFDIMGVFGFGRSFHMLESDEFHYALDMMKSFMALLGPLSPVPWLCRIGMLVPILSSPWWNFKSWCQRMYHERAKRDVKGDVFDRLMDSEVVTSQDKIEGDAIAVIIAGSDTSACVLLFLFYYLVKIPSLQDDLRSEISAMGGDWHSERLEKLPLLNALIKETMRIYPPLATSGLRTVGPSGLQVGDVFVPPGITIAMPMYSFGRLESCYERASEFLPERWLDQPQMVKNRNVCHAFGKGRYACPGKNLALREIRLVVATLVARYTVAFAPGEDGRALIEDMRDEYVVAPGNLQLSFIARNE